MAVPYSEAFKTLFSTIFLINTLGANVCNESLSTVQHVTFCPGNFTELQLAVKRKRCDALANIQTCVPDPTKFVYHCLVNQQNDGFVEVCAPEWILAGFCGYYDTKLDKIVTNVKKDCTKFAYPCPDVFNSSDSYKYQDCYEVKKKEQGIQICDEKRQAHPSSSVNHVLWIVPSVLAVVFFLACIFACLNIRVKFNAERNAVLTRMHLESRHQILRERMNRRIINRQDVEKNREKQRRLKGNAPLSTPRQNDFNSTYREITTSTPKKKELKREQMSTDTDITAATEGDISGIGEEDEFIKKSENTPSSEGKRSGKKKEQKETKQRE